MAVKFKKGIDLQGQRAVGASDPTTATDLVTKQYADRLVQGVSDLKDPVRGTSTANLAVATALVNGLVHDGVTYATGDRILLKNQTAAAENGIYVIVASGAASRAADANTSDEVTRGMSTTVLEGTNKGTGAAVANPLTYVLTTPDPITLGTTSLAFSPLGGTGSTSKAAGSGLTEDASNYNVGAGTGSSVTADAVAVDTSVVARKYAADCVVTTNPQTFTHNLGSDVHVTVWEGTERVFPDVTKAANTVTIDWGAAPTAAQYRVVVVG